MKKYLVEMLITTTYHVPVNADNEKEAKYNAATHFNSEDTKKDDYFTDEEGAFTAVQDDSLACVVND